MRHTLLPLQEKIVLRREYRFRAVIVLLLLISAAGFIGIISLFPSFIKASYEEKTSEMDVNLLKVEKNKQGLNTLEENISLSKKLLAHFDNEIFQIKTTAIINNLIAIKDTLRITSISISRSTPNTATIIIQGIAPTRNSLLAFKTKFESALPGNKVDLPVSQLGKSTNLQFSLKLTETLQ